MYLFGILFISAVGSAGTFNIFAPLFGKSLKPTKENGRRVTGFDENYVVNPGEFGEYFEGDITNISIGRNGILHKIFRWPNGMIPYVITGNFSKTDRNLIFQAMEHFRKNTCIRFRQKRINDKDFVDITNNSTGCYSTVGRFGGRQVVNLQIPGCNHIGVVTHELLHSVGFFHEQSRTDRDEFVKIRWENILPGHEHNFQKYNATLITDFQVEYDYDSIMHYPATAFSSNKKPTIVPIKPGIKLSQLGQRTNLSSSDILKIRRMYGCRKKLIDIPILGYF